MFHHPNVPKLPGTLTSQRSAFLLQSGKQCATVTYIQVSRWHPRNADAFYLTTINGSLDKFNTESLLLQEWQVIKTELHILQETHNVPSLQPVQLLHTQSLFLKVYIAQMLYMTLVCQTTSAIWSCKHPSCLLSQVVIKYGIKNERIRTAIQFCTQISVFQYQGRKLVIEFCLLLIP